MIVITPTMRTKFTRYIRPKINIYEVGPRDGFQNIKKFINTDYKIKVIDELYNCNIKNIEITSLVNPSIIPQFKDSNLICDKFLKSNDYLKDRFSILLPTKKYMETAINYKAREVAIFTSPSDKFNLKNINCTVEESFKRFEPIFDMAKTNAINVRGYVSCISTSPIENDKIEFEDISKTIKRLIKMGCYQVSLGDTTGTGTPKYIDNLLDYLINVSEIEPDSLAVHFHNTNGKALKNIEVALEHKIYNIDSSIGGLGGCPFAKSTKGNVATEDVLNMLNKQHFDLDGIDVDRINKLAKEVKANISNEI